jgi:hypothetical protein
MVSQEEQSAAALDEHADGLQLLRGEGDGRRLEHEDVHVLQSPSITDPSH